MSIIIISRIKPKWTGGKVHKNALLIQNIFAFNSSTKLKSLTALAYLY